MIAALSFGQIVDAADSLPLERQEELAAILHRRIAEAKRHAFVEAVRQSEAELDQGLGISMTPDEFAAEIAR